MIYFYMSIKPHSKLEADNYLGSLKFDDLKLLAYLKIIDTNERNELNILGNQNFTLKDIEAILIDCRAKGDIQYKAFTRFKNMLDKAVQQQMGIESVNIDYSVLHSKLEIIRERLVNGGNKLNKCLTEGDLLHLENAYGLDVPEPLRSWVMLVGDGGAAPDTEQDELKYILNELSTHAGEEGLTTKALLNEIFPFTETWFYDDGTYTQEGSYDDIVKGRFCIANGGCEMSNYLIVNGPNAGQIFQHDEYAITPLYPARSMIGWYEDWLEGFEPLRDLRDIDLKYTEVEDARDPSITYQIIDATQYDKRDIDITAGELRNRAHYIQHFNENADIGDKWVEVQRNTAISIAKLCITMTLKPNSDLAESDIQRLAGNFVNSFSEGAKFYTNSNPPTVSQDDFFVNTLHCLNSSSNFDAGILCESKECFGILWQYLYED